MNKKKLIDFEKKIANLFNNAKIKAPIHLYSNNEDHMLKIFKDIGKNDWVFCSWRSHYQCLLKGVPEKTLIREILKGKSISLTFPSYRIISSAIVTGNIPIALGLAISIKLKKQKNKVHCFMGEMTAETGIAHEAIKYARNHSLPIRFIIEDNKYSVCTLTSETWNQKQSSFYKYRNNKDPFIYYYQYKNKYPHAGSGKRIKF